METLIILVKLLCAHLFSDFILQTDRINSGKRKPGHKRHGLFDPSQFCTCMYSIFIGGRLVMLANSCHHIH